MDRAHDALERQYAPAYASKLISLAAAALAPLAAVALANSSENALEALVLDGVIGASTAAAVSALTSSDEYRLRVEEYKGFDLDLWLPLSGALVSFALSAPPSAARMDDLRRPMAYPSGFLHRIRARGPGPGALRRRLVRHAAACARSVRALRPRARDEPHASSFRSHAARRRYDARARTRPVRKWAGLAPFGLALSIAARREGMRPLALAGTLLSVAGHAAANTGFRRPERDPLLTARAVGSSWLVGSLAGLLAAYIIRALKPES